jgi:hypothetical protein
MQLNSPPIAFYCRRLTLYIPSSFLTVTHLDQIRIKMKLLFLIILPLVAVFGREVTKPGDWTTVPDVGRVDHLVSSIMRRGDLPLDQNIPDTRNKHKESVPVFRKSTSECNCPQALCPVNRMKSDSVVHCQNSHAYACWRKNAACPKPEL